MAAGKVDGGWPRLINFVCSMSESEVFAEHNTSNYCNQVIDDLRSYLSDGRRKRIVDTSMGGEKKNVWRISLLDKQRDSKFHCVCADQADLQHKQNLEHFCAACTTEFWLKSGKEARIQLTFWPKSGKIREREPRRPKIWRKRRDPTHFLYNGFYCFQYFSNPFLEDTDIFHMFLRPEFI